MRPSVGAEIESGDARPGHCLHGVGDQFCLAGQGKDRAVVVRVGVEIKEDRTGSVGQFAEKSLVPTLAEVDDALDGHVASLSLCAWRGRSGPGEAGLAGGDGDGL